MFNLLLMILLCYLVGSIPTAIIAGKILKKIDIREHGSGNAGATNVFRVLGWKAGLVVLLIDMLKGLLATVLFYQLGSSDLLSDTAALKVIAGLAAVFGHIWTVFARFKGGKGVATSTGVLLILCPKALAIAGLVWLITVFLTRYVSLGSILGSLSLPISAAILGEPIQMVMFTITLCLISSYKHDSNIIRLINGEEPKLGQKIHASEGYDRSQGADSAELAEKSRRLRLGHRDEDHRVVAGVEVVESDAHHKGAGHEEPERMGLPGDEHTDTEKDEAEGNDTDLRDK